MKICMLVAVLCLAVIQSGCGDSWVAITYMEQAENKMAMSDYWGAIEDLMNALTLDPGYAAIYCYWRLQEMLLETNKER